MKSTAEVLRDAAALIETHGWQPKAVGPNGSRWTDPRLDLTEAVAMAVVGERRPLLFGADLEAYRSARRALLAAIGRGDTLLSEWNDQPGRTADDVISLLTTAAASASGENA